MFAVAPVGSWLTEPSLREIDVPIRAIVGRRDVTTPAITNAERVARLIPGAQLSVLEGVGHYTFLAECGDAGLASRRDLCRDGVAVDRAEVHREVASDAVAFFRSIFESR